jgi:hypothetical protein
LVERVVERVEPARDPGVRAIDQRAAPRPEATLARAGGRAKWLDDLYVLPVELPLSAN